VYEESGPTARLRERLTSGTEDRIGRALADLLDNPLVTGAIGKAFDARERAAQAQELALGALNIPTAADIERLTRRLRSVSQRLEGIEDGVQRIGRALADASVERRLSAVEKQLKTLNGRISEKAPAQPKRRRPSSRPPA
jgi:anti-sigma-K factor RskA